MSEWKYIERGELPEKEGEFLVTDELDLLSITQYIVDSDGNGHWWGEYHRKVRAWRELPEPAPPLEPEGAKE